MYLVRFGSTSVSRYAALRDPRQGSTSARGLGLPLAASRGPGVLDGRQ